MQKDFHYYSIYVLCRCNGMSPENANKVAYSSQHTDDAKYDHALNFENGGRFRQVLSAHRFLHPEVFSLDAQYKIYVPFHFLPGNLGNRFQERMVCRENSELARKMLGEAAGLKGKPYQLHRLGIALHAYADTWSHQDFSGLQTDLNDIEDVDVLNEDKVGISAIFRDFFRNLTESLIPRVGHAEAAVIPDEPYREWSFVSVYTKKTLVRKNWEICLNACREIYKGIRGFLTRNPRFRDETPVPWGDVRGPILDLFKRRGGLEERCANWMERINGSDFGFQCQPDERYLSYGDREWFRTAVGVQVQNEKEIYIRKDSFHLSDWKHFHDAAASHEFFVLQECLSPLGIVCG